MSDLTDYEHEQIKDFNGLISYDYDNFDRGSNLPKEDHINISSKRIGSLDINLYRGYPFEEYLRRWYVANPEYIIN